MTDRRAVSQLRIDGRAIFAAAAYLLGVGLIFLLDRIGAPDGLLHRLGPLLALGAIVLIGALVRTTRIAAFYAADRAASPLYAGSAFAAIAAGLVASAEGGAGASAAPSPVALMVGLFLAALVVGPMARGTGASSLGDIAWARFDNRLFRLILGLAYFGVGALIAAAGFEVAAGALSDLLGVSSDGAIGAVGVVLAVIVAPGGLAGLLWVAAAAGGMIALVLVLPIVFRILADMNSGAQLFGGGAELASGVSSLLTQYDSASIAARGLDGVAIALGTAILPPLSMSAFVSFDAPMARRAGVFGLGLVALFALAFALGAPLWPAYQGAAAQSIHASAGLVCALICAAAGVQTASRAAGADSVYGHEGVLASRRLARGRGLAILAVALSAVCAKIRAIGPATALVDALALSLLILGPALILATSGRARAGHAAAALLASVAAAAAVSEANGWALAATQAPTIALTGAAAGFVVGWAASAFGGSPRAGLEGARSSLFVESSFDPDP